ncbi:hypothetical protein LDENG_00095060 [Lucifuga dentata]|nr:hypothetical protein LDENG_00095060 [Lucifuga dentata]
MEAEPVPPKRAQSYVWEHFDFISFPKSQVLDYCSGASFSSNTSSMLRISTQNTQRLHPTQLLLVVQLPARQVDLDDALVEMVVMDSQPFSVVEDKGFRAFVQKLDPSYVLPTRQTLKTMVEKKIQRSQGEGHKSFTEVRVSQSDSRHGHQ